MRTAWNKGKTKLEFPNLSKSGVKKGNTPWNKGKKGVYSEEYLAKLSIAHKGQVPSEETKQKLREARKGKKPSLGIKPSLETRRKMSLAHIPENHWSWKGGITPLNLSIRRSLAYREWRSHVFKRDKYTCINCNQTGGRLNADHIKPFSLYPKLRLDISNGRTLCEPCHKLIGWSLFKERNPRNHANPR